jgi:hypothetical protein
MRHRTDCFPDGHPGYPDWLAEYPKRFVLTLRADRKQWVSFIVQTAHTFPRRANSVPTPANMKNIARQDEKRLSSGQPNTVRYFGHVAHVSKPDGYESVLAIRPCQKRTFRERRSSATKSAPRIAK